MFGTDRGRRSRSLDLGEEQPTMAKKKGKRKKDADGTVEGFESHEFGDDELGELRALEDELALLLAEEDVEAIGAAMEPGSVAAVLV